MDLGLAIGIFLLIAIVVMALFCIVTKYFNYKLQKALDDGEEVYSMIDEINTQDDMEGQYQEFIRKRQEERNNKRKPKSNLDQIMIEMTSVRDPLVSPSNNIYGLSRLRRRLDGETIPMRPQTERSSNTMRSFRPDALDRQSKLAHLEDLEANTPGSVSKRSTLRTPKSRNKRGFNSQVQCHKFLSKIVAYTEQGIQIVENEIKSLRKPEGGDQIVERKVMKVSQISPNQKTFQDQLQVYGFEKDQYGAYKFMATAEIPHMKQGEQYPFTALKITEQKESIDFMEYYKLKSDIQDQN